MDIRKRREELGLTQKDLAIAAQAADKRIDSAMISRFENGVCLPSPAVQKCILTALQAPFEDFSDMVTEIPIEAASKALTGEFEEVINAIPIGKANAISRSELRSRTGLPDRKIRLIIAEARTSGYFIVNTGYGYYIADNSEDLYRFYKTEHARAISIFRAIKNIRADLKSEGYKV